MRADVLRRLFFWVSECSAEGHTLHLEFGFVRHPIVGTCEDVPVPRKMREVTEGSLSDSEERSFSADMMIWNSPDYEKRLTLEATLIYNTMLEEFDGVKR